MSNLKCPFCQQELHKDSDGYYTCYTDNCGCMKYGGNGASGSESLWLALIRTRKALDKAINAMNSAGTHNSINCIARGEDPSKDDVGITINHALNEIIPILERKDVK